MPQRVVRIMETAADDLNDAREWLHQSGSGPAARRRYQAVTRAIRSLRTEPVRYRRDTDDDRVRVISVEGYRIIYRVTPGTGDNDTAGDVAILAVLGPGEP